MSLVLILFTDFLLALVAGAPNFVVILTDDQDVLLNGLTPMTKTLNLMSKSGAVFTNAFVNSPVCCPSRSTLLTGKYLHNTGVRNNSLEGNCSSTIWQKQHEPQTIAALLKKQSNYSTFYAGKYLNQYGGKTNGGIEHVPVGYDWWIGLKGNSKYYNYTLSVNGTAKQYGEKYLTDVIKTFALEFLNQRSAINSPFFMMVAPPAPHAPFTAAPRHTNTFPEVKVLKTPSFNYSTNDKHWLLNMRPKHLPENVTILSNIQRHRLQSLLAVDEMVEAIFVQLNKIGVLRKTYVIFTSDNGFHIGQFSQPWDKRQPYETDIRIPFLITGPDIAKPIINQPISFVDVAPTILDLANADIPANMDGRSFKQSLLQENVAETFILIEYFGEGNAKTIDADCPWHNDSNLSECTAESWCKCQDSKNNTYSCLVHFNEGTQFKFCQFYDDVCFIEAYDVSEDPYELTNVYKRMSAERILFYENMLKYFTQCVGLTCNTEYLLDRVSVKSV